MLGRTIATLATLSALALPSAAALAQDIGPRPTSRCRDGEVTLNFTEANLVDVVRFISEVTGRRFLLSGIPDQTTITIISTRPVCRREAYEAFLTALAGNGLAVVRRGRLHVITFAADAVRRPIPIEVSGDW